MKGNNIKKIVYLRGLWSHPQAVLWIKNHLEKSTQIPVDLYDYHDLLIEDTNNVIYVKRVKEKFGDLYAKDSNNIILMGHSHGGTLVTILADEYEPSKIVLTNPAFRPWGMLRQPLNQMKKFFGRHGIGEEPDHHFVEKYEGEADERTKYFMDNFNVVRDISRVLSTGSLGLNSLRNFKRELLMIQSMKDEFVSVKSSLDFYDNLPLDPYCEEISGPSKSLIMVPNGEHAILEERDVYPEIYSEISNFIKR